MGGDIPLGALGARPFVTQAIALFRVIACLGCRVPAGIIFIFLLAIHVLLRSLAFLVIFTLLDVTVLYIDNCLLLPSGLVGLGRGLDPILLGCFMMVVNCFIQLIAIKIEEGFGSYMFLCLFLFPQETKLVSKPRGALEGLYLFLFLLLFLGGEHLGLSVPSTLKNIRY